MLKTMGVLGVLLMIVAGLAACGTSGDGNATTSEGSATVATAGPNATGTIVTLNDDYSNALPVSSQLAVGTLTLEGTDDAVTVEQAGELLPSWQMLEALQSSGTAAEAELDAVLNQIQRAMTDEQLKAVKEMQLTPDNMMELMQEQGLGLRAAGAAAGGGFRPPAGVEMGGGGGPGGRSGALGGGEETNPEEQEAAMAERMNTSMAGMVVSMLEARAEGETWEVAAPSQETMLQSELITVIADVAGLDQQAIRTQTREGDTLLAIAEGNGVDVDEIIAQVITADTERVNQAVADGSLEQTAADQWLAGLEAQVREMLENALEFDSRGMPGS